MVQEILSGLHLFMFVRRNDLSRNEHQMNSQSHQVGCADLNTGLASGWCRVVRVSDYQPEKHLV